MARKPPVKSMRQLTGIYAVQRGLHQLTTRDGDQWLDKTGAVGRALREWRDSVIDDLGGIENTSTAQRTLVDFAARSVLMLSSIDDFLISLKSPVDRRRKVVHSVIVERERILASLSRTLERCGLERRPKPVASLAEIMAGPPQIGDST